jgi:DHA1 family multidrug resistance protein-like MFS transporter
MTYFVQYLGVPIKRVAAYSSYVMLATGSLMTIMAPLWGLLADRVGHKRVLVGVSAAAGLAILPTALVKSYAQFFVLRMSATVPGSGVNACTGALVARAMPRSQYGGAYGVLASARALAGSVGPIIGGSMGRFVGLPWVFVWTAATTLLAAALAATMIRETSRSE